MKVVPNTGIVNSANELTTSFRADLGSPNTHNLEDYGHA